MAVGWTRQASSGPLIVGNRISFNPSQTTVRKLIPVGLNPFSLHSSSAHLQKTDIEIQQNIENYTI
jgi:hypothetical protein